MEAKEVVAIIFLGLCIGKRGKTLGFLESNHPYRDKKEVPVLPSPWCFHELHQPGWRMLHCPPASDHSSLPMPCLHPLLRESDWEIDTSSSPKNTSLSIHSPPFLYLLTSQNWFIFFLTLLLKKKKKEHIQEVFSLKSSKPQTFELSFAEQSRDLVEKEEHSQKLGKSRLLTPLSYKIVPHVI